ncbi:MAG: cupredoxin domain-containing protein [Chloroflexota bacterium]|jgi:plastocyanin|nr:cupredoxin domain-containing protein [Chloroflexota bacterium]
MHRSRRLTVPALFAALVLLLAACASGTATPSTEAADPTASVDHAEHSASAEPSEEESAAEEPSEEPSEEATAEEVRVRLESSNFDPSELTIAAGTTVLFLNGDSYAHTVTEGTGGQAVDDPIVDRELAENRTVRVTFDEPGTFDITCELHPSMQMTITVEG